MKTIVWSLLLLSVTPVFALDTMARWSKSLRHVLPYEPIAYSSPNLTQLSNMSTHFHPRAMGHLYYITDYFMNLISRDETFPTEVLVDQDGDLHPPDIENHWKRLLYHYTGPITVAIIGLLFAVFITLTGLIVFCCRCCCCCRDRTPYKTEKRRDPCKRVFYGMLLGIVTIIILFGVVCAFVTNEYMEMGIKKLPSKIHQAMDDTNNFLTNTNQELNTLFVTNFEELEKMLNETLKSGGKLVSDTLAEVSNAVLLTNLTAIVYSLRVVRKELNTTQLITGKLRVNAQKLGDELDEVHARLVEMLKSCQEVAACRETLDSNNIKNLSNRSDFYQLPNVSDSLSSVDFLITHRIEENVMEGKLQLDYISKNITQSVTKNIPTIIKNLREAGAAIKQKSDKISAILKLTSNDFKLGGREVVSSLNYYMQNFVPYRYYVDISVSSVLLLIFIFLTLGLFYGFCGKQLDGTYGEDCCNKATGASFLMLAVWIMFLFSAVLMLITLAHFLLGFVVERSGCQSLRNPKNSDLFPILDNSTDLSYFLKESRKTNVTVSDVIMACHQNQSLYEVLRVSDFVNISEVSMYMKSFKIEEQILALEKDISFSGRITLLTPQAESQLRQLANSPLNTINFTSFSSTLGKAIFEVDLLKLASMLDETASQLKSSKQRQIQLRLRDYASHLKRLQLTLVQEMVEDVRELQSNAISLQEHLRFNHTSLAHAIENLLTEVKTAEKHLTRNGSKEVKQLAVHFVRDILHHIEDYQKRVVNITVNNLGKCGPMSQVYNATLVASCDEILKPFNGFWASIGWCILLFIPGIWLSMKLAALYRKIEPYHGPIHESEYLYDAYADRDNIPLANGPDKKSHHRRYNETYDNSSGYMGDYVNRGDRGREDMRFSDMAPKYSQLGHWDYGNGQAPRYHSPSISTEYERPPPYYYPGPGESASNTN